MTGRLLLPLPGFEAFAARLAAEGAGELLALETRRFPDGERYLHVLGDPRGRVVELVCGLEAADDRFLTLAFTADALRDLGAARVNLIAPYLGYMRQDARFQPGEAITARTFARLVASVVDGLITVDPHLHRIAALGEVYPIPCRALASAPLIGAWIAQEVEAPLIVGPDAESEQWAAEIAAVARAPYMVLNKVRTGDRDVAVTAPSLTDHRGRQPVLIDDIASSGRTLVSAAEALGAQGLTKPVCAVVHAIFAGDALQRVRAACSRVVSTDTIAHPTNAIGVAPLIAQALRDEA